MKDIAPELLEKIKNNFNEKFDSSKKIKSLYKKVKEGKADYEDAQKFAQETGRILSQAFQNNLSSNELPNGKLYYNIANRVIREMLKMDFNLVADLSVEVQNTINKKASINIKGIKPKLNKEKADGIIDLVSGKDVFDDISYMLDEPIVNFSQSVVDDTVKTNAEFQYESGFNPKIRRTSKNKCCEWCNKLAGEYNYEETKGTDVYRRHTNCNCLVEFIPGNGKKQNVHTKKWSRELKNKIKEIEETPFKTGRSLGAMAKRFYVRNLKELREGDYYIKENTYVEGIKVIAHGEKIRDIKRLINQYTLPNGEKTKVKDWYKVRGRATIIDKNGNEEEREIHWYQADNIGKVEFKFPSNPKQR